MSAEDARRLQHLATVVAVLATLAFVLVWWVHGVRSRRALTREVAAWWCVVGVVRCWWDLASGLSLVALGIGLWRAARRVPGRPLDDRAPVGRWDGADDGDDDDEEGD